MIRYIDGSRRRLRRLGTAVAVLLAYFDMPLIVVALAASAAAFLSDFIF